MTATAGGWRVEGEFGSLDVRGGSADVDVDPMHDMVDYSADPALAGFRMQDSYLESHYTGEHDVVLRVQIVLLADRLFGVAAGVRHRHPDRPRRQLTVHLDGDG